MLEKELEEHLRSRLRSMGYICLKFTSPSARGVPDRIIFGRSRVWLVELKRPGGVLSKLQKFWLAQFAQAGIDARVIASQEEADAFVSELEAVKNGD